MQLLPLLLVLVVCAASIQAVRESTHIKRSERIIGGEMAEPGFAPYQVSIQTLEFEHICGGCIISEKYILTAGHCIKSYIKKHRESEMQIVTGTTRYEEPGGVYFVKELILHCNYNNPELHNDIAMIRLNSSIIFDNVTQKVLLPSQPLEEGDEVVLTGWGNTDLVSDIPDDLQKITLKYVPHTECSKVLDNDPGLDVGHICTYTKEGEGACYGDSGSPLVKDNTVYGVVNWGYPCATGKPDVQASVYFFNDWIRSKMNGL